MSYLGENLNKLSKMTFFSYIHRLKVWRSKHEKKEEINCAVENYAQVILISES